MKPVIILMLEAIRQALNSSDLKWTDPDFYYKVKDFCCEVINTVGDGK